MHGLLSSLDISADAATFTAARDSYRAALDGSTAISDFRVTLAEALTGALPDLVDVAEYGSDRFTQSGWAPRRALSPSGATARVVADEEHRIARRLADLIDPGARASQ